MRQEPSWDARSRLLALIRGVVESDLDVSEFCSAFESTYTDDLDPGDLPERDRLELARLFEVVAWFSPFAADIAAYPGYRDEREVAEAATHVWRMLREEVVAEWWAGDDEPSSLSRVVVDGSAQLAALLESLHQRTRRAELGPLIVELVSAHGPRLGIGVGSSESVLTFGGPGPVPAFASVGSQTGEAEEVGFRFCRDLRIHLPGWSFVGRHIARRAAEELLKNPEERPAGVEWVETAGWLTISAG